ncbi:hypothetical protein PISL3812_06481 [Talaromyces islandicus]|uniref:Transcription factor tau 55 kDa subunit n=1 Tax=Talaromyces islandicus TaxID=28573 RepID=A0A0U1M1H4_TALIS|nr:hypothetical protein PISL3812_06481 [Talaromyces islandicus]
MNWTIDYATGTYHSAFPTATGNPADPTLTAHGVRQSHELAAHVTSDKFTPKPWVTYSSPFYRCLQTIQPSVEGLNKLHEAEGEERKGVRIENGLGEWFGASTYFDHPPPASPSKLRTYFPTIITAATEHEHKAHVIPSSRGETIPQLHNRVATALAAVISDVDAQVQAEEARTGNSSSKAILICSHAAPLIAMGRALTGNVPEDVNTEDFYVYTAGLSTFVRRRQSPSVSTSQTGAQGPLLAAGTRLVPENEVQVPDWRDGKGVGGGWDCVSNGDCSFLSGGEERGWHFNGEESFDTGPMAEGSEEASKL